MKTISKSIETILKVSEDGKHTYSITKLTEKEKKKHMIIVLLYPTRTEENMLSDDDTMNHILYHLKELNFDSVTVINLFSRVVAGARMSVRGIEVDKENLDYISESFIQNEDFKNSIWVIAWGNSCSSSKVVNDTKVQLLEAWSKRFPKGKLYQLSAPGLDTKDGMTVHPLYLGIRSKFGKWSLEEYPWKKFVESVKRKEREKEEKKTEKKKE